MKINHSSLGKSLSKQTQSGVPKGGSNRKETKPKVHHSTKKKHQMGKVCENRKYHEQTQELLERNFKQLKSLQPKEAPIIIAEPTFVYQAKVVTQPESQVFETLDNMIPRDSQIKAQVSMQALQPQRTTEELSKIKQKMNQGVNNRFALLSDDCDEDENTEIDPARKQGWTIAPATFQLPKRELPAALQHSVGGISSSQTTFDIPSLPKIAIPTTQTTLSDDIDPDL